MDKNDITIIKEMSLNSRKTLKEISSHLKISKEATNLRINKLINNKIITPYSIINYFNIGNKNIHIGMKFEKLDVEDISLLISNLTKKNSIGWIAETFHEYDLSFSIIYKEFETVEEIFEEIKLLSRNRIKKISFLNIKSAYYFSFINGRHNSRKKVIKITKTIETPVTLRSKNKEIIKYINQNSRFKLTDIGNQLNLTPNSIKYLIKEMEKKDVILDYGLYINYLSLGFKWYKIILESYTTEEAIKNLFPLENVVFICRTYEEKIIIDYISKDTVSVRNFVNEIEKILGKINSYEIYEIIKTHKIDNTNKQ